MGYTPAFDSIYTGTLYGKWPAAAVWASLLPLISPRGELSLSYEAIAGMTGWPMDLLRQGIAQLMEPDADSRTPAEEGRRLVLIDPSKSWGWRAVNHAKYREKARLQAKDSARTEGGHDAERKRQERAEAGAETSPAGKSDQPPQSPGVPRSPLASPSHTQTQTQTQTHPESERARARPAHHLPEDFELTPQRRAVAEAEHLDPERTFAAFRDHWRAASGQSARKRDWDAAWRNWCRKEADFKPRGKAVPFTALSEVQRRAVIEEAWERQRARALEIGFRMPLAGEAMDNYRAKIDERVRELDDQNRGRGPASLAQLLQKAAAS
jgi:hypothetical protein